MVNYKKTGKYIQTPVQDPTDIYVGVPEQVDYTGKSTRIDDNFTYIAEQIGGPEKYHAGTGLVLYASVTNGDPDTFRVDDAYLNTTITAITDTKQPLLTAGNNIEIVNNVINVVGLDTYLAEYGVATTETKGLMSAEDKSKLDSIDTAANNYVLPAATTTSLGGIIVGTNLSIQDGVLSATNTTYEIATPSASGAGGSSGLISAIDKEKLDSISLGATRVTASGTNGYIVIDNNAIEVYRHPTYSVISGIIPSGKLINGISVDDKGHVTGYSTTNETGINVSNTGTGNVIVSASYNDSTRTLTTTQEYLGNIQLGYVDNSTEGTAILSTDRLSAVLRKLQNAVAINNNAIFDELDLKLEFKGNTSSEPQTSTEGDVYKATASFTLNSGSPVVTGDLLIRHNSSWFVVPSGEKSDTWRPLIVDIEGTATEVLPNTANSGPLRLKGTGITDLVWDANTNTLSIQTLGVGPGGAGGTTYYGGTGISEYHESSTDPDTGVVTYITTFNLDEADANTLGGIKLGSGLSKDANGVVSVVPVGYTGINGISIENGVIQPNYGLNVDQVARGNHTHNIGSLLSIDPSDIQEGDVVTFYNQEWRCLPPVYNTYTGGNNVTITATGDHTYRIDTTDTDTNRGILINNVPALASNNFDAVNFIQGNGIVISPGSSVDGIFNITISSTNCSGGGGGGGSGTEYSFNYPLYVNGAAVSLAYDSTLSLDGTQLHANIPTLATVATSGSYTDLINKPSIPTNTWRPISDGTNTLNNTTTTLSIQGGTGISTSLNTTSGVLTITNTGGSGSGTSYTAGNGIDITGTAISVKVKSDAANAVTVDSNGIYCPDTTYSASSNGGLTLSAGNAFSVDVDNSTIKINNNKLYVADTSTVVPITTAAATISSLANNTIYKTDANIYLTSLAINALASGFSYCTLSFVTGSNFTGMTLGDSTWRVVGYDSTYDTANSKYPLQPNKEYQIAVDNISGSITFYVLRLN